MCVSGGGGGLFVSKGNLLADWKGTFRGNGDFPKESFNWLVVYIPGGGRFFSKGNPLAGRKGTFQGGKRLGQKKAVMSQSIFW